MAAAAVRLAQSRLESAVEQVLNVGSGFVLAFILWQFVLAPTFGFSMPLATNLWITTTFTVASVIRGYLWRRLFNRRVVRRISEALHHV